jgi:hypothetical protein
LSLFRYTYVYDMPPSDMMASSPSLIAQPPVFCNDFTGKERDAETGFCNALKGICVSGYNLQHD